MAIISFNIIKEFFVIFRRIGACVKSIRKHINNGMDYEDAWQMTTVQLVGAAEVSTVLPSLVPLLGKGLPHISSTIPIQCQIPPDLGVFVLNGFRF